MITVPWRGAWGWPWHGLSVDGDIALPNSTTKTLPTPPAHGNAWLIDMGLPAISLSDQQTASATANGYQWRNYAMITGGLLNGTDIGDNSYIYVDPDNASWLVSLAYYVSVDTPNTLRITATIKRYGVFGVPAQAAFERVVYVACENITVGISGYARSEGLQDVWTNGERALVGVFFNVMDLGAIVTSDLRSVVEVTLSGRGGVDGAGISIAAAEVYANSWLWINGGSGGNYDSIGDTYTCRWNSEITMGYFDGDDPDILHDRDISQIYSRTAYYNADGSSRVLRLRLADTAQAEITGCGTSGTIVCSRPSQDPIEENIHWVSVSARSESTIQILENDTLIDHVTIGQDITGMQTFYGLRDPTNYCINYGTYYHWDVNRGAFTWTGTLSAGMNNGSGYLNASALVAAWRSGNNHRSSSAVIAWADKYLGIQRMDAKAAAFFIADTETGARTFGTISTPLGPKTYSTPVTGQLYFAWQRKTGEFTFSESPIAYF